MSNVGNVVVTTTPAGNDVILGPPFGGAGNIASTSSAGAGGSINQGVIYPVGMTSAGKAVVSYDLGNTYSVSAASAGKASGSSNLLVIPPVHIGDIIVRDSAPDPGDIEVGPDVEEGSLASTMAGQASASFNMGNRYTVQTTSNGVAAWTPVLGNIIVSSMRTFAGVGDVPLNRMYVIPAANRFVIFTSHPPYEPEDVLMGTREGPGTEQGFLTYSNGEATATFTMGQTQRVATRSDGVASGSLSQSTSFAVRSTSNGVGAMPNYLGSPVRMAATGNGVGGARDQFGATGKWYLGSSTRMTATSAGQAGCTANYLASRVPMVATSAGRAGTTNNYLSSRIFFAMTSAGRATSTMYLASRIYFTTTMAGRAGGSNYLSSPARILATSAGRATVVSYIGSPVYWLFGSWYSNGAAGGSQYLSSPFDLPAVVSNGVSANLAYIAGPVSLNSRAINGIATASMQPHRGPLHFGPGSFTARGVATMNLDPGLLYMTSNGVGHVNNIPRPTDVFMQWGLGPFFYERHFPVIEALLIPKGSNGMSYVSIEIDTIPIMHHHSDGVAAATATPAGMERRSQMQTVTAGCFDWTVFGADAEAGLVGTRRPWFPSQGALNVAGTLPVYSRQTAPRTDLSITMTLTPVPVVWNPKGIATVSMLPTINFFRRWQTWADGEPVSLVPYGYTGSPHPYVSPGGSTFGTLTRRAGGVGTMAFAGPKPVSGLSQGRANVGVINRLGVAYASNLIAVGISTFSNALGGGDPVEPLTLYGNMLRYFFIPTPDYGQIWPRRERLPGQPV